MWVSMFVVNVLSQRQCEPTVVVLVGRTSLFLPAGSSRLSARRNTSLPATRAELAWLSQRYVSFQKLANTLTTVLIYTASGFTATTKLCSADSRRSRMPVKGGGRLASYPSKSENVGVSDAVRYLTCVKLPFVACIHFAITRTRFVN